MYEVRSYPGSKESVCMWVNEDDVARDEDDVYVKTTKITLLTISGGSHSSSWKTKKR